MITPVARWESKSGKHWVEVYCQITDMGKGYGYTSNNAGAWLGDIAEEEAIRQIERRLEDFQPDRNKTPMIRMPLG